MPDRYLTRNLNQTVVYWASPVPDGYGGKTFDDPVEIDARWEDRQELFIDAHGNEVHSHAVVIIDQDVDMGGYLYLGDLDDLSSEEESDPQTVSGAREIRSFQKVPNIRATAYRRTAWL